MTQMHQPIADNRVIQFESLTRISFVSHFFTTRTYGLGKEGFKYLRFQGSRRDITLDDLDLTRYTIAFSRQAHTDRVVDLKTLEDVEQLNNSDEPVDALITQLKNVALFTVYADCTPVYVVDRVKKVIGLAHSGWRGTVGRIAPKMIAMMQEHYGTELKDLAVVLGPSISMPCFEVGEEVREQFEEQFGPVEGMVDLSYDKPHVDVRKGIEASLLKMGIHKEQIEISTYCTYTESETFYSYRRDGQTAGRMAAVLIRTE